MRAALTVIIPTQNAQDVLPGCLAALMEGLALGLIRDVVISDGGSEDATRRIADDVGAIFITGAPSRGAQLRRGADAAEGEWLLFLHADTVLSPGWSGAVIEHLETRPQQAGYCRLRFDAPGLSSRWVAGWANVRSALFGLPYGDQALLISQALYHQSGGYPDQPLMEDVTLVRRLRGALVALPITARTSAARYVQEGWTRRGGRNLWLLLRYLCGADPHVLAQSYRRLDPKS